MIRRALFVAAALILASSAAASSRQDGSDDEAMILAHDARPSHGQTRFVVEGRSKGRLYPGAAQRIKLTVTNPGGVALVLRSLDGRLARTSRAGCPATPATLTVSGYSGALPITIKPYARRALPGFVAIAMPRTASPRCSNTRLVIEFSASGSRAGR